MAQPSVASYFNSRKKSVIDEILNKQTIESKTSSKYLNKLSKRNEHAHISDMLEHKLNYKKITRVRNEKETVVKFFKKGILSPKRLTLLKRNEFTLNAPGKHLDKSTSVNIAKNLIHKELNFDEVKTKLSRSKKLEELKASICRIREIEKACKIKEGKNKLMSKVQQNKSEGTFLKLFETIDLEILSPSKYLNTPVKLCPSPDKFSIMSPKSINSKQIIFSPSKFNPPVKTQAHNRYSNLTKDESLTIPFKYKNLGEIFKSVDSVCAMYFNRKECITFKKLKSAVQRIIRTSFDQTHLAQIKHLYTDAYYFSQSKVRNYGSVSKHDYFQLIIIPNIKFLEDKNKTSESDSFNPQLLTLRYQKFQHILIEKVKEEHDKFLRSLDPPLFIPKNQIKRWHPEFDLENCADIEQAKLPQPPDIEKFSSAKEMLSTARNLFTNSKITSANSDNGNVNILNVNDTKIIKNSLLHADQTDVCNSLLLKTVPLSLIEKIRVKQAIKAQGVIIRRPSEDFKATKYSHITEVARHLRNVFVTEKRSVLTLEVVINKLSNSYGGCLTQKDIEEQLYLIATECPTWVQIHQIRKATYLKMRKEMDITVILKHLKNSASEKLK